MSSDGAKLVRAAQKGDDAKVKRLLKAGVDVNGTVTVDGVRGVTALQAEPQPAPTPEAKPHVRSDLGEKLVDAAHDGDIALLKRLLKSKTLDVDYADADSYVGHACATAAGRCELVNGV